jgi:hypothetical protein
MKLVKYAYIFLISILLLPVAAVLWIGRWVIQVTLTLVVDWPLRKLVFSIMWVHEWLLSKAGLRPVNSLREPRIPRV